MEKLFLYIRWIGMLLGVTAILHTYIWWRLVRTTEMARPWSIYLTILVVILALSYPAPFFIARNLEAPWRQIISLPSHTWMGFSLILFTSLLTVDVMRLLMGLWGYFSSSADFVHDPTRRVFMVRALTTVAGLSTLGLGAFSIRTAFQGPQLRKVRVKLPHLPQARSGTKIVQISDLHIGHLIDQEVVQKLVEQCNQLSPDLVAITGDLVDHDATLEGLAPLAGLRSTFGTYFVTGNHEYYSGIEKWMKHLPTLGIRILRNERVSVGEKDASFDLVGVDDYSAGPRWPGHGPDLDKAMKDLPPQTATVLLAHQPKEIFNAAKHRVGLQLSGHTHGGQIWPFNFLVRLSQPYISGLHQHEETQIYVNRGTGFWGPPMRLGGASELTLIELVST